MTMRYESRGTEERYDGGGGPPLGGWTRTSWAILGPSWGPLGPLLGLSWALLEAIDKKIEKR